MSTLIKNALKGNKKATETLYSNNKHKIYFLAKTLLNSESLASDVTVITFTNIWKNLTNNSVETEVEFSKIAIRIALEECKKRLVKQNPKALRIPENRNFLLSNITPYSDNSQPYEEYILSQFSDMQRLIFVTRIIGGCDNQTVASVVKLDAKTLEMALSAEKENVNRISNNNCTYENFENYFSSQKATSFPQEIDAKIMEVVENMAKPYKKKQMEKITTISIVAFVVALAIAIGSIIVYDFINNPSKTTSDTNATSTTTSINTSNIETSPKATSVVATHYAEIDIKDYGTITVALDEKTAPITVKNFVSLVEKGFYDGLTFHRIIEGFMMQGGDPLGNGTGGSEEEIKGEFSANGVDNNLSHIRGAISMARSSDMNSASSQFFIVHKDSPHLDGQYAVFGYVTDGIEIVDKVCGDANPTDGNGTIEKADQPIINKITVKKA